MPTLGYYSASVLIEGHPAPEYAEEGGGQSVMSNGTRKMVSYIESKTGSRFAISVTATNATNHGRILIECYVDRKKVNSGALGSGIPYVFEGARSGNEIRSFFFANVKLVNEDNLGAYAAQALLDEQKAKGIEAGQIRVEFWAYQVTGTSSRKSSAASKEQEQISIHEKAKKVERWQHFDRVMQFFFLIQPFLRRLLIAHNIVRSSPAQQGFLFPQTTQNRTRSPHHLDHRVPQPDPARNPQPPRSSSGCRTRPVSSPCCRSRDSGQPRCPCQQLCDPAESEEGKRE